jgi:hypothetical protein
LAAVEVGAVFRQAQEVLVVPMAVVAVAVLQI